MADPRLFGAELDLTAFGRLNRLSHVLRDRPEPRVRHQPARPEDFARICIDQRQNASAFPHALFRKPLALEEYLSARPIALPLRLYDCLIPCAGAEAFLVMTDSRALELGQ